MKKRWDQHSHKLFNAKRKMWKAEQEAGMAGKETEVEIEVALEVPPEKIIPVKKWGDSEHDTVVHSTNVPHVGKSEYDQKFHTYRVSGG